ncbi:MAG TPA: TetR/AcrR family transcriptional regulator [Caulobacteraceae bacterium]|nr:TetR/AcrR family transcriptional regulator [Caulobacteraceae bacterium]
MSDDAPHAPPQTPPDLKAADGRPYHHGDLRRALVDAGRRLLEREGSAALSLRAVAREAGVSAAAPYHHFKDRAALLYAVAHEGNVALNEMVHTAFENSEPGQARIVKVGMAYVGFALANPALYDLMFETTRMYDSLPDSLEAEGQLPRLLAATFGASLPARRSDLDRHLAAIAGWAMFRGLAEVAQFRTMEPFKALLGGDKDFLEAVLGRLDFSDKPAKP